LLLLRFNGIICFYVEGNKIKCTKSKYVILVDLDIFKPLI
jgi:hypothetical protein